jgi:hypothetical protein
VRRRSVAEPTSGQHANREKKGWRTQRRYFASTQLRAGQPRSATVPKSENLRHLTQHSLPLSGCFSSWCPGHKTMALAYRTKGASGYRARMRRFAHQFDR